MKILNFGTQADNSAVLLDLALSCPFPQGPNAMALYRCYFIGPDEHIHDVPKLIEAVDDRCAADRAQQLCNQNPTCSYVELWCGMELILRLSPVGLTG